MTSRVQDRLEPWQAPVGKFLYGLSWLVILANGIAGPVLRSHYGWGDDAPDWVNLRMFLVWPFAGYILGYILAGGRR